MHFDSSHLLQSGLPAGFHRKSLESIQASRPFVAVLFALAFVMTAFVVGAVLVWSH